MGLAALAAVSVAITTEFENVPAQALAQLATTRPVAPSAQAVGIAQDRVREKAHFAGCGVPVAPYAVIETAEQLAQVNSDLFPGILKTARMGYDGAYVAGLVTLSTLLGVASLPFALGVLGALP